MILVSALQVILGSVFRHRPCPRFPLCVQQHTRIYDYWWYEDKRPRGHSKGLIRSYWSAPIWIAIAHSLMESYKKQLHCQSACPYWRSCILMTRSYCDSISKLCVMTAESSKTCSSWNIEAIIELPVIASVLSSCSSPLQSPKPYTNTHIQASCLHNNSISACLFRCGLSRIDTIVLFLPINVKICEIHSFRSGWHISRLAVMHGVWHFAD